jgi:hypothetical protein
MEKQTAQSPLAYLQFQLSESEIRYECKECNQAPREYFIFAFTPKHCKTSGHTFAMEQPVNDVLKDGENADKTGKYNCFAQGGVNQGFGLIPSVETECVRDKDYLGQYQRLNDRGAIVQVTDLIFGQDKPSIPGEDTEENRQIRDVDPVVDELVRKPLLPRALCLLRLASL